MSTSTLVMWGSKKLEAPCDPSKPVGDYMETLQKLTGVPVQRMKLMMRRKSFKPTDTWGPSDIKPGCKFMLIGTAELAPELIDTPEEEVAEEVVEEGGVPAEFTVGLKNFGNTCYLNAVLQTLRAMPELIDALKEYNHDQSKSNQFVKGLGRFYENFPGGLPALVQQFRTTYASYAEKDPQTGTFMQQDASEAWGDLLKPVLREIPDINKLMELILEETLEEQTFDENIKPRPAETKEVIDDRLRCTINPDVKEMEQGILIPTDIERTVGDDKNITIWKQTFKVLNLPKYLVVQMMRFSFRADEGSTVKIVRRVHHPLKFDLFPFLAGEARDRVVAARDSVEYKSSLGFYRLKAVLTHQGRTAGSGHYITHLRVGEHWMRYDDQKVTEIEEEDIENLSGSGDWHSSFLLIYEAEQ